jgi:signal transduction histidine kinase
MKNIRNFKVKQYVTALLMVMFFSTFYSFGQEESSVQNGNFLKQDSILVNQYIQIVKKVQSISPDSSLKLLNLAYGLARKHDLKSKIGTIWGVMAARKIREGNFKDCKLYLDSAFLLNEQLKNGELTCYLNVVAAGMYQSSANYANAASHYFRALEAVREYKLEKLPTITSLYNNLGALMSMFREDSLALQYKLLAKKNILQTLPVDSGLLTTILLNIGQTYLHFDSSAAISYFKEAFKMAKRSNDPFLCSRILIDLAHSYMAQAQYDSAEYCLHQARQTFHTEPILIEIELARGSIFVYKKNYIAATEHFESALKMASAENAEYLEEIYNCLSEVYAERKQHQKAYEYQQKYLTLYESKKTGQEKIVLDFMLHFQSMEHEKTILQKQTEILAREATIKKRNQWIIAMCLLLALLGIIIIMAYRNYHNRKTLMDQRMSALLQQEEIKRLKAEAEGADRERTKIAYDLHDGVMVRIANVKMNLHGLSSILQDFRENNRYQDIIKQLDMATVELRNTAHNLMPEILLEGGVTQAIFYFCKTTEQATGLIIKFQQIGQPLPRLQPDVENSVYRIVQGLIQNVIRHAQATTCLVQLQCNDHLCSVTVEDNGRGFTKLKHDEGYGLKSIRNRIKLLNGIFEIESEEGNGTTAYLEFDVIPYL